MPFGKLVVVCGPMFAGKTTYLINGITVGYINHVPCKTPKVYKHTNDLARRGTEDLVSHKKQKRDATCIGDNDIKEMLHSEAVFKKIIEQHDWVILDEVQFFDAELIFNLCHKFLAAGINICCASLNQDSFGKPFGGIGNLMAMADNVILLHASCDICKRAATKTQRLVASTEKVVVGGEDMFQPRCLEHWSPSPKSK